MPRKTFSDSMWWAWSWNHRFACGWVLGYVYVLVPPSGSMRSIGEPSLSCGTWAPCRWIEVGTERELVWRTTTRRPDSALMTGPGKDPLKVRSRVVRPGTISLEA